MKYYYMDVWQISWGSILMKMPGRSLGQYYDIDAWKIIWVSVHEDMPETSLVKMFWHICQEDFLLEDFLKYHL